MLRMKLSKNWGCTRKAVLFTVWFSYSTSNVRWVLVKGEVARNREKHPIKQTEKVLYRLCITSTASSTSDVQLEHFTQGSPSATIEKKKEKLLQFKGSKPTFLCKYVSSNILRKTRRHPVLKLSDLFCSHENYTNETKRKQWGRQTRLSAQRAELRTFFAIPMNG